MKYLPMGLLALLFTFPLLASTGFVEYCRDKGKSDVEKITIEAIADAIGTKDCVEINEILSSAESLRLDSDELQDLKAVGFFENLVSLGIASNSPVDVSQIKSLKTLTSLSINAPVVGFNEVFPVLENLRIERGKDISIKKISRNSKLSSLFFYESEVSDYRYLVDLKNLMSFTLFNSNIERMSEIALPKSLVELNISGSRLRDISGVESYSNISMLSFDANFIEDVSPLAKMPQLTSLWLSGNPISDISPISDLKNIHTLNLSNLGIRDIRSLGAYPKLKQLWLSRNNIKDISPVARYKELILLDVTDNNIENIDVVAKLPILQWLFAARNYISAPIQLPDSMFQLVLSHNDIGTLDWMNDLYLPDLEYLSVANNKIRDLSPVVKSGMLFYLDFSSNQVYELPDLSNLSQLLIVKGRDNKLANISQLQKASMLGVLDLRRNRITDVSSLKDLEDLDELRLNEIYLGNYTQKTKANCPTNGKSQELTKWCKTKWIPIPSDDAPLPSFQKIVARVGKEREFRSPEDFFKVP